MPVLDIPLDRPLDVRRTLAIHWRGPGDLVWIAGAGRVWRAVRTMRGPAVMAITPAGREPARSRVVVEAWGPGAEETLTRAPALIGMLDDPDALKTDHPIIRDLQRRFAGLRIGRTGDVMEALLPAITEQKVTGAEARQAYRRLVAAHGEPAPVPPGGPAALRLPPDPTRLAALPYYAFHELGLERRRAETIRRVAARATRLAALVDGPPDEAYRVLTAILGVGPWTAAEVGIRALGDPDAVSVGDYHLPHLVCWALAREARGSDARMLELLEPFRGQRGRVIRLLELGVGSAPRRGPRMAPRRIEAI